MTDEPEVIDAETSAMEATEGVEPSEPRQPMPPVLGRFMFVDVAALRVKQLRLGALPRVDVNPDGDADGVDASQKIERIAMREVEEGLIVYNIPDVHAHVAGADMKETE